jgi:cold shock CspA family protein
VNVTISQSLDISYFNNVYTDDDDAAKEADNLKPDVTYDAIASDQFTCDYQLNTLDSRIGYETHEDNDQSYQDLLSWCSGSSSVDNFTITDDTKGPSFLSPPSELYDVLPNMSAVSGSMHIQEEVDVQNDIAVDQETHDTDPLLIPIECDEDLASSVLRVGCNEDLAYYGIAIPEKDLVSLYM